jgi:proliferating cell nuclear antigen
MDSSHVSLVSLMLNAEGFEHYRCDRGLQLGINLGSMSKILKCAGNDDAVTLKSEDAGSVVSFTFESQSTCFSAALLPRPFVRALPLVYCFFFLTEQDKVSEFDLKLLEIESDILGIPDTEYAATVKMPAAEFQRICRDLTILGDTGTRMHALWDGPSVRWFAHFSFFLSHHLRRQGWRQVLRLRRHGQRQHQHQAHVGRRCQGG